MAGGLEITPPPPLLTVPPPGMCLSTGGGAGGEGVNYETHPPSIWENPGTQICPTPPLSRSVEMSDSDTSSVTLVSDSETSG